MKKALMILLAIVFVIGIFAGCSDNTDTVQSAPSAQNSVVSTVFSTDDIKFIDAGGDSVYRIVRPVNDAEATATSQFLYKQMKDQLGVKIRNVADEEDGTDQYEILIGNCNRSETEAVKNYLKQNTDNRYEDYAICTVGKKIVIYSQSAEALKTATQYFFDNFVKAEGVKGGIKHIYKVDGDFENITINGVQLSEFIFVREHYNASYLTELEMNDAIATLYQRTGYKLSIVHDAYTKPTEYEIIVGNADREGVETVTNYDEYRITVKGTKVYLNGGSAHATALAVAEFQKMLGGEITDASSVMGSYDHTISGYDKTTTLYKTWGEDFDGDKINTDVWKVGDPTSWNTGLNGKLQLRSTDPNDVFVKDGKFHICAREDERNYYGGIIQTYKTYKYGYIEMSSKIPHGTGFWTALYLCSDDGHSVLDPSLPMLGNPEYDVMECFGNSEHYQANIHSWPSGGADALYGWEHISLDGATYGNDKRYRSVDKDVPLGYDFHTYGMMWDNELVTFTCDADPFFSYDTTTTLQDIETNNHNVWIRIAMNVGSATNPEPGITENPEDWINTGRFIVDWVNVYQKNDGLCEFDGNVLR